jgi:hypothetical protein
MISSSIHQTPGCLTTEFAEILRFQGRPRHCALLSQVIQAAIQYNCGKNDYSTVGRRMTSLMTGRERFGLRTRVELADVGARPRRRFLSTRLLRLGTTSKCFGARQRGGSRCNDPFGHSSAPQQLAGSDRFPRPCRQSGEVSERAPTNRGPHAGPGGRRAVRRIRVRRVRVAG